VGLPWESLVAFLRIVTNPRIFRRPQAVHRAWAQVEAWLNMDSSWIPTPTRRHRELLGALITASRAGAELVPDAHLAALAIEHGLVLVSTDGDFARFRGLRWENPLAPP
jgi:toxin-antitoxin system PIN domain toxin